MVIWFILVRFKIMVEFIMMDLSVMWMYTTNAIASAMKIPVLTLFAMVVELFIFLIIGFLQMNIARMYINM